jgi:flagellar motor switch protein FliN/FliY
MSTVSARTTQESRESSAGPIEASTVDFGELSAAAEVPSAATLESLLEVSVTVSAELGRAMLPISEVLRLGAGSVVELKRLLSEPVDLIVQGVRFARGEVVVVDDHFAIRIKELCDPKKLPPA